MTEIEALFVKVLVRARDRGVLKLGPVALDGTKIHASASRHSALSYEHAGKLERQLKAEVAVLLAKAAAADKADVPDGMSIPEDLERREQRLRQLAAARAKIAARANERFAAAPPAPQTPTPLEAMADRLATPAARSSMLGESTPRSRGSASSNRFSACANSGGAGSTRSAASGA